MPDLRRSARYRRVVSIDPKTWRSGLPRAAGLVAVAATLVAACGGSSEKAYTPPETGPDIYAATCATCHGPSGQGFVGPSLVDTALKYPNIADEIAIVTNGRGQMPAWGGRLTTKQIANVVEYTRGQFASGATTTNPDASGPPAP